MIVLSSLKDMDVENSDYVFIIVRSPGKLKFDNTKVFHIPELSPSWELFKEYRDLYDSGNWNERTFQDIYAPKFLQEMHRYESRQKLNEIYKLDKEGKIVSLVCYCPTESLCHRCIVGGLLQGAGCTVKTYNNHSYKKYYCMYKENRYDYKK